ncbi:hypothetical protein GCM10027296_17560 [Chitinimonas naiadis]
MRVIEILLALSGIARGDLDMAERISIDPYFPPGRRDRQGPDTGEYLGITYRATLSVEITKAAPMPITRDASLIIVSVMQAGTAGCATVIARVRQ